MALERDFLYSKYRGFCYRVGYIGYNTVIVVLVTLQIP